MRTAVDHFSRTIFTFLGFKVTLTPLCLDFLLSKEMLRAQPNSAICNLTNLEVYLRPSVLARSSQTQGNVLSEHARLIAAFRK